MGSTTLNFGAEDTRRIISEMPSFIAQTPNPNSISKEASTTQSSRISDYRVLERYIGFGVGDVAATNDTRNNVDAGPVFNSALNSQTMWPDLQSNAFNKSLAASGLHFTEPFSGSNAVLVQKGSQHKQVSASRTQHENVDDSNMMDSSSHTDTSTDVDPDDRNKMLEMGQSAAAAIIISQSGDKSKEKAADQKMQRRLAQNREAARKSRLKKKAYVQQLENSRLKLTQLEQEVKKARKQGIFISSCGDQTNSRGNNGALAFDVEYARWKEEQNRQINELRTAVNSHAADTELRPIVDNVTTNFNNVFRLKGDAAKADVFHILSGMWKTPVERCFMWIGGFRPSELLKLIANQLEPLTEQQLTGVCNLQQSSQQAEDALTQGMDALQQSLAETLANGSSANEGSSGNVANYMGQMAMAMGKLGTLEGFLRQADNLRQQTLQQMHRTLTIRQYARALLLIHDYFSRLCALSSLWLARPQEG